jgi:hypothetical protein
VTLISAHYSDFGPTLASEKLLERHKIEVSNETVRKLMIDAGIWQTRAQRSHFRREHVLCILERLTIYP